MSIESGKVSEDRHAVAEAMAGEGGRGQRESERRAG